MEQSPSWEAKLFSASHQTPRILGNPTVHYRIHKFPPRAPILSQLDPVHTPHSPSWRFVLILFFHLRLGLPSGLFSSDFPTKTLYTPLLSPMRATCPAHLIFLDFMTRDINTLTQTHDIFVKILLMIPNTLRRTVASTWLCCTMGFRTDHAQCTDNASCYTYTVRRIARRAHFSCFIVSVTLQLRMNVCMYLYLFVYVMY
jgi:hypothetical protein